jgi:glycosyltransferase involved in cell wall biosynthesis
MPPPCIAVFAHNEERRIARCLESLTWASRDPEQIHVKVLINGSTDGTEQIVRDWAASHPNVEPVVIALGDKANAWNTYVYSGIAFDRNLYFLDGDCWLPPYTIDVLEEEFARSAALCIAPLPLNVSDSLRAFLTGRSLPCGTLYGLRGEFLRRLVAAGIRMPVGFIGDDNLVASLVKSDLSDHFEDFDHSRVRVVDRVGPVAHRPPLREAIRLQRRRLRRYALRSIQRELLNVYVRKFGLRKMPATAKELYRLWREPGLGFYFRWRGLETPYVWRALWQVVREARSLPQSTVAGRRPGEAETKRGCA